MDWTAQVDFQLGADRIASERVRQILDEGWAASHDDLHTGGELVSAAIAYVDCADSQRIGCGPMTVPPEYWPWDKSWWKPSDDPVKNLVKAGALIAAEIDRLIRLSQKNSVGGNVAKKPE